MELLFENIILYAVPIKNIVVNQPNLADKYKFGSYKLDTGISFYSIKINENKPLTLKELLSTSMNLLELMLQTINDAYYPILYIENIVENNKLFTDYDGQTFLDSFLKVKNIIPHDRVVSLRHYSTTLRRKGYLSITDKGSFLFNLGEMDLNLILSIFHSNVLTESNLSKGFNTFAEKIRFWNMNCDITASYHKMEDLYNSISKSQIAVKWNEELTQEKIYLKDQTESLKGITPKINFFLEEEKSNRSNTLKLIQDISLNNNKFQKYIKEEVGRLSLFVYILMVCSGVTILVLILILLTK